MLIQYAFVGLAKLTTAAPTGNAPLTAPLLRVLGSVTATSFLAYSHSCKSVLQWVSKTRVSAPPPPPPWATTPWM